MSLGMLLPFVGKEVELLFSKGRWEKVFVHQAHSWPGPGPGNRWALGRSLYELSKADNKAAKYWVGETELEDLQAVVPITQLPAGNIQPLPKQAAAVFIPQPVKVEVKPPAPIHSSPTPAPRKKATPVKTNTSPSAADAVKRRAGKAKHKKIKEEKIVIGKGGLVRRRIRSLRDGDSD